MFNLINSNQRDEMANHFSIPPLSLSLSISVVTMGPQLRGGRARAQSSFYKKRKHIMKH